MEETLGRRRKPLTLSFHMLTGNQVKILDSPAAVSPMLRFPQPEVQTKAIVRRHSRMRRPGEEEQVRRPAKPSFNAFEEKAGKQ